MPVSSCSFEGTVWSQTISGGWEEACSLPDYFPVQRKSAHSTSVNASSQLWRPLAKDEVHGSSPIANSSLGCLLCFAECRTSRAQEWRGSLQCMLPQVGITNIAPETSWFLHNQLNLAYIAICANWMHYICSYTYVYMYIYVVSH